MLSSCTSAPAKEPRIHERFSEMRHNNERLNIIAGRLEELIVRWCGPRPPEAPSTDANVLERPGFQLSGHDTTLIELNNATTRRLSEIEASLNTLTDHI